MTFFSRRASGPVLRTARFDIHWDTEDPFIFASHHEDDYPHGNRQMAPPLEQISGRNLGRDFQKIMGFRMYNGKVVPGFPMHAHWGYETVTLAEKGFVDHFDSEGREGRFGDGDVQWVCASSKYMHNEMYPLVDQNGRNPNDITQIMINLPLEKKNKGNQVSTVWREKIPSAIGNGTETEVICGRFGDAEMHAPNSGTYAEGNVRILRIAMDPEASLKLDPAPADFNRNLYVISGTGVDVSGTDVLMNTRVKAVPDSELLLRNGDSPAVVWVLEGRPIGQKMAQFGPVCLADTEEVRRAMEDIRRNEYSEWPFDVIDKVHLEDVGRFMKHPDGTEERPPGR